MERSVIVTNALGGGGGIDHYLNENMLLKTTPKENSRTFTPLLMFKHTLFITLATCFHADFSLGLFLDREDEGNMFVKKVG
jgi:hypothetical protein